MKTVEGTRCTCGVVWVNTGNDSKVTCPMCNRTWTIDSSKVWTKTPPKEPGWYWAILPPVYNMRKQIVRVEERGTYMLMAYTVNYDELYLSQISDWMGPITVPEGGISDSK